MHKVAIGIFSLISYFVGSAAFAEMPSIGCLYQIEQVSVAAADSGLAKHGPRARHSAQQRVPLQLAQRPAYFCFTAYGSCPLFSPLPVGYPCFCPTPYGPIAGRAG